MIKFEDDSSGLVASNTTLDIRKVTSFEGILQNGMTEPPQVVMSQQQQNSVIVSTSDIIINNSLQQQSINNNNAGNNGSTMKKNMLADLLERTVGGDILNGVVDKELRITSDNRLPNGPVIVNNVNVSSGGVKRAGSEDYDESGAKRLAIDRGDGKITLYVSQQNGGTDTNNIMCSTGEAQQVGASCRYCLLSNLY